MIYGYARVSTKGQAKDGNSLESQQTALKTAGAEKIYVDSFTGTKMNRPQFSELVDVLKPGDTLIVTKLDRFARSISQASDLITDLIDKGITINVLNLGTLSNDSVSTLLRNVLLSFAQIYFNDVTILKLIICSCHEILLHKKSFPFNLLINCYTILYHLRYGQ